MSDWGRATFGDPCRECGYSWSADLLTMIETVMHTPDAMTTALAGSDGTSRSPELHWDARSYVCHVVDNLRIWAERLIAASSNRDMVVARYDADLLAEARNYVGVPVGGALWSLREATNSWKTAVEAAARSGATLQHPERGPLTVVDVASTNAHDAHHHVFDVRRCVK